MTTVNKIVNVFAILTVITYLSCAASLDHHWKLDDFRDSSNALDSVTSNPASVVPADEFDFSHLGVDSTSGYFYSDNVRIELGNVAPDTNPFSVSFFFKMREFNHVDNDQDHIISANQGQEGRWAINLWGDLAYLDTNGGKPKLVFWQNTYGGVDISSAIITDRWYHVAITRSNDSSSNFKIYLDGILVHTGTNTSAFTQGTNGVWLGRRPNYQSAFDGWMDDVRFYDDALTDTEVFELATLVYLYESPVSGTEFIDPEQLNLTWQLCNPIVPVDYYKVYFSTDQAAVQNTSNPTPYKGDVSAASDLVYNVGDLELDETYYWRIDTVLQDTTIEYGSVWEFTTEPLDIPGVIISHSPKSSGIYLGSPAIAVLPNGDYVASCDEFGPNSTEYTEAKSRVFTSKDRGKTWRCISYTNAMWPNLFVHNGDLYQMGCTYHPHGNTVIRRSSNGGWTWTDPVNSTKGLLSTTQISNAPTPAIIHNGRIWLSMLDNLGANYTGHWCANNRIFLMSFDVNSDPLVTFNWSYSQKIDYDELNWFDSGWLEGNVVLSPEGSLVSLQRLDYRNIPEKAAIVDFGTDGTIPQFDPDNDFVTFYGGCKKFTIRYDEVTDLYWALSNPALPQHSGYDVERARNALAIMTSPDLRNWTIRDILLYHSDIDYVGFQYPYFVFDGNDILSVIRLAYDDGMGGADDMHNSNFLMFYRIEDFRSALNADLIQHWELNETVKNFSGTGSITTMPISNEVAGGSQANIVTPEDQQYLVLLGQAGATTTSGTSVAFNSRYDRIELGDVAPCIHPFTIAFWFNTGAINNYDGGPDTIMSTNRGQDGRWAIDLTGSTGQTTDIRLNFYHVDGASYNIPDAIDAGQWYHVAMTRSNMNTDNYKIYLNGVQEAVLTDTTEFTNPDDGLGVWVGRRAYSRGFNGLIDDIRFYNAALSDVEVALLYIAEEPGKSICVESIRPDCDFNLDCTVDMKDFAEVAEGWMGEDMQGFEYIFSEWLECGFVPYCLP